MVVDLTTLPNNILKKIPRSLYLNETSIDIRILPHYLQNLLRDYTISVSESRDISAMIEAGPDLDVYSDFVKYYTVKDFLVETIKNYLQVRVYSYPFDPLYGNRIKEYLHQKDTSLQQTMLGAELQEISEELTKTFGYNVKIIKLILDKNMKPDSVEYTFKCEVKIQDNIITFKQTI